MNIPGAAGESSTKRQENGDVSMESDRPLKKARFAWQVKGKYHLKNDMNDTKCCTNEPNNAGSSSENDANSDKMGSAEQNLEILSDYLLKKDFNTLDSVIDSDKSLLNPDPNISPESLPYPRYMNSSNSDIKSTLSPIGSFNDKENMLIPMSMVVTRNFTEEQCIARWQAKQIAKGFIDNTINRVLDTWMVIPMSAEIDNHKSAAIDIADFINNLPGDDSIENEGILMAISAHGLQNNSSNDDSLNTEQAGSSSSAQGVWPSSPPSLTPSDDGTELKLPETKQVETDVSSNDFDLTWQYDDEFTKSADEPTNFSYISDMSSSQPYFHENEHRNVDFDCQINNNGNNLNGDIDFLDAAISFAIQNRGLTSYGTDYG